MARRKNAVTSQKKLDAAHAALEQARTLGADAETLANAEAADHNESAAYFAAQALEAKARAEKAQKLATL